MKEKLKHLLRKPFRIFIWVVIKLPYFRFIYDLKDTNDPISFNYWFKQKILGYNKNAYWPVHSQSRVVGVQNIYIGIGTNPGYNPGCYIQGTGKLFLGNYITIGQNTGILSGGHDLYNHAILTKNITKIGNYCWIGMNVVILPGVELGDFTIVAAGAVVTKSFTQGYCIVGGNPAKIIKQIEPDKCVRYSNKHKYHGYIRENKFEKFRKKNLKI